MLTKEDLQKVAEDLKAQADAATRQVEEASGALQQIEGGRRVLRHLMAKLERQEKEQGQATEDESIGTVTL